MRQVGIAGLADEPSTGLDLKNQARVLQLLRDLMLTGMSLLVSIHHPEHALYLADSGVLMGRERVLTGPASSLLTDTRLSELYGVGVTTLNYDDGGTHAGRWLPASDLTRSDSNGRDARQLGCRASLSYGV
jgi:ABC-type cobalamin/Fe3+-siderophores transport system ATPase subunit